MLSRRALVGKLAAGVAVAWVAGPGRAKAATKSNEAASGGRVDERGSAPAALPEPSAPLTAMETAADAPWELIRPMKAGDEVASGWRLAAFRGLADDGSFVVTLENAKGRKHRVHICRNDGRPEGLVHTKKFDLIVMNGGQGDLPTDEGLARAVARLGRTVARNESAVAQSVAGALMSHQQRLARFSGDDGARLR